MTAFVVRAPIRVRVGATMSVSGDGSYSGSLPTYLASAAVLEWVSLTGIGSANVSPGGSFGSAVGVTNAWGGGAIRQSSGHFLLHGGGHLDYAGNEIYALDVLSNAPSWSRVWGPTPFAQVTATPYYADGNPASAHTYYYLHWDETNDRLLRVKGGPGWQISGVTSEFNSWPWGASNWNADGTHPDVPSGGGGSGPVMCRDPATGDVVVWDGFYRSRWARSSNSWVLSEDTSVNRSRGENASATDTSRNRVVILSNTDAVDLWNLSDNTVSLQTATGSPAFEGQMGAAYDPDGDCVWYITNTGSLRRYDCATHVCTVASTTGTGPSSNSSYGHTKGYFNRFQYVTALKALVMQPAWSSPTFVIRVA